MKERILKTTLTLGLVATLLVLTACSSTRTENGVTIEESGGWNPLSYIPGL